MPTSNFPASGKRRNLLIATAGAAAATLLSPMRALAQGYPERPITFICPWPAGGTADQSMRALCQVASRTLGQAIAVENKVGASGMIGTKAMASAKADGYTIGQIPISVTRFSQLGTLQLDPLKDLTYLARTSGQTFGIATPADSRFKSLQEVVAFAKANPGKLTYAHAGIGGATHVGMEEFAMAAGIQFNHVPYKGGAEALQAVLGGHVDLLADSSSWAPHVEAGKLKLLATWASAARPASRMHPRSRSWATTLWLMRPMALARPKAWTRPLPKLRDAFRIAVASPEFKQVADRIDAPVLYLDGPDYEKYVAGIYQKETVLIDRLKLKELMKS